MRAVRVNAAQFRRGARRFLRRIFRRSVLEVRRENLQIVFLGDVGRMTQPSRGDVGRETLHEFRLAT